MDKPIIIYTLEKFQASKRIDEIEVVCLEGWEEVLKTYALQYGIAKLNLIVPGGNSSQESIYIGLKHLEGRCKDGDIVLIHDGIRPMVADEIIDSCIDMCMKHGNGITAIPIYEQIFKVNDAASTKEYIPRDDLRILQTPQAYRYQEIRKAYETGFEKGIGIQKSAYANTLMAELGKPLYFAKGSTKNIKITTRDDIEIFKAMLRAEAGDKKEKTLL